MTVETPPAQTGLQLAEGSKAERCTGCGNPLAVDQRYCLNCGKRRAGAAGVAGVAGAAAFAGAAGVAGAAGAWANDAVTKKPASRAARSLFMRNPFRSDNRPTQRRT